MKQSEHYSRHERWALLRFAVVGQLLAAPPPKGELRAQIEKLAAREWRHPITGLPVRFGISTIERWYHRARKERQDPVRILRRKVRADVGAQESLTLAVRQALRAQHAGHLSWSTVLHHDNLCALAKQQPGAWAGAVVLDDPSVLQSPGSAQAPPLELATHRRRRARRGALGGAGGA